jgi:hypothetical protein
VAKTLLAHILNCPFSAVSSEQDDERQRLNVFFLHYLAVVCLFMDLPRKVVESSSTLLENQIIVAGYLDNNIFLFVCLPSWQWTKFWHFLRLIRRK